MVDADGAAQGIEQPEAASRDAFRIPKLPVLLAGLFALVWSWRTLDGGFLSDDFLLSTLLRDDGQGVDWAQVFADYGQGWFGVAGSSLYRPLLTTSFGVDSALYGVAPFGFHLTNVLLHVIAVMGTAVIAAVLARRSTARGLAAFSAGLLCAVHPAVVESVAWIAARNSGIEVAFRNVALACFALSLVHVGRRMTALRVGFVIASVCALGCKESAVLLLPSALAIDALDRWRRPLAERLRLHAPLIALLVAYFALRTALFGTPIGSAGNSTSDLGAFAISLPKLGAVLWPSSGSLAMGLLGIAGFVGLYILSLLGAQRQPRTLLVAALWLIASVAPTFSLQLFPEFSGSRMILGAVHAWAVAMAVLAFGQMRDSDPLPRIGATALAFVVAALAMLGPTLGRVARFERAWSVVDTTVDNLQDIGADCGIDRPLALFHLPETPSTPPLNANAWFPLAQRPTQTRDIPMVSLGYITVEGVPGSEALHLDPSAARALWADGSPIALWDEGLSALRTLPERAASDTHSLQARNGAPGAYDFAQPVHPLSFDAIVFAGPKITTQGGANGWTVDLRTEPEIALPEGTLRAPVTLLADGQLCADFSHLIGPYAIVAAAPTLRIRGLQISNTAGNPSRATSVRALPNRSRLALEEPVASAAIPDQPLDIAEFESGLRQPTTASAPLRLIILSPHTAIDVLQGDDGRFHLDDLRRADLDLVASLSRLRRFWYFYESVPGSLTGPPVRSPLHSFVIAQNR